MISFGDRWPLENHGDKAYKVAYNHAYSIPCSHAHPSGTSEKMGTLHATCGSDPLASATLSGETPELIGGFPFTNFWQNVEFSSEEKLVSSHEKKHLSFQVEPKNVCVCVLLTFAVLMIITVQHEKPCQSVS